MQTIVDLASRRSGSIEVALMYDRIARTLAVFVHDAMTNEELLLPVSGDEALEVYHHPYAHAHRVHTPPTQEEHRISPQRTG